VSCWWKNNCSRGGSGGSRAVVIARVMSVVQGSSPSVAPITPGLLQNLPQTPSSEDAGVAGGSSTTWCVSAPNACGMTNAGTIASGGCNATTPANIQCPVPSITFYASPAHVRAGQSTTLHWSAINAIVCNLSGGLSEAGLPLTGSRKTAPITQTTIFSMTCLNGTDGSQKSASVEIKLIPTYKEI